VVVVSGARDHHAASGLPRADRVEETADLFARLSSATSETERREVIERLVELNLGVARDVARRYRGRGIDPDDLDQVAYLGLVKAVVRFDPGRGVDFLGYAVPTVRGEIQRWFRDAGWAVRPPRSLQELQARVVRCQAELTHALGRPPKVAEIAAQLEVGRTEVERALATSGCFTPSSLDAADTDEAIASLLRSLGATDPGYAQVEARTTLVPLLCDLDDREKLMLRLRFVHDAKQDEIADELGVTQAQVSRLLTAVLARLRRHLEEARPQPGGA
jgi:RNA polymerase sigma-B factor